MDQLAPSAPLVAIVFAGATATCVLVTRAVTDLLGWWRRWVVRRDDVDGQTVVANLHRIADLVPVPTHVEIEEIEVVLPPMAAPSAPPRTVDLTPTRPRHSPKRCASSRGALLR